MTEEDAAGTAGTAGPVASLLRQDRANTRELKAISRGEKDAGDPTNATAPGESHRALS